MPSLDDLKKRISSVKSTQKITKAMKMVAAAKLRKAQDNMEKSRPYTNAIEEMINHLIPDIDRSLLPILETKEIKKKLFLVVSSDRGMAGAFNSNIIKKTEQEVAEFGSPDSFLICIGKKSHDYFKRRDYNIIDSYRDFWNTLDISIALKIGDVIIDKYLNKEITLDNAKELVTIKTRQYAKRQSTWAKGKMSTWTNIEPHKISSEIKKINI